MLRPQALREEPYGRGFGTTPRGASDPARDGRGRPWSVQEDKGAGASLISAQALRGDRKQAPHGAAAKCFEPRS